MLKDLPTAFFRSAKNRRTCLGPKAAPDGPWPPEFRVRYVVRTNVGRFKFDDRSVKLKQFYGAKQNGTNRTGNN